MLGVIPVGVGFGNNFDSQGFKGFFQADQLLAGPVVAHPTHRDTNRKATSLNFGNLLFGQVQIGSGKARSAVLAVRNNNTLKVVQRGKFHRFVRWCLVPQRMLDIGSDFGKGKAGQQGHSHCKCRTF